MKFAFDGIAAQRRQVLVKNYNNTPVGRRKSFEEVVITITFSFFQRENGGSGDLEDLLARISWFVCQERRLSLFRGGNPGFEEFLRWRVVGCWVLCCVT